MQYINFVLTHLWEVLLEEPRCSYSREFGTTTKDVALLDTLPSTLVPLHTTDPVESIVKFDKQTSEKLSHARFSLQNVHLHKGLGLPMLEQFIKTSCCAFK